MQFKAPNPRVFKFENVSREDVAAKEDDERRLSLLAEKDRGGVVPGTVWTFCPQQGQKMPTGDYHNVFNSGKFLPWWKTQLLPNLSQPSLIIIDDAKYHCKYPDDIPRFNRKKAALIAFCDSRNIPVASTDTVPMLRAKVKEQVQSKEKLLVELFAEAEGHHVLFTPLCYSDFQPMELLWANVKGNIGGQYNSFTTTMAVLKQRLDEELEISMKWNEVVSDFIRKSTATARNHFDLGQEMKTTTAVTMSVTIVKVVVLLTTKRRNRIPIMLLCSKVQ